MTRTYTKLPRRVRRVFKTIPWRTLEQLYAANGWVCSTFDPEDPGGVTLPSARRIMRTAVHLTLDVFNSPAQIRCIRSMHLVASRHELRVGDMVALRRYSF